LRKKSDLTLNRNDKKIEAQNTMLTITIERIKNLSAIARSQINSQLLNLCNEIDVWKLVCQVLVSLPMLGVIHNAWNFLLKGKYIIYA